MSTAVRASRAGAAPPGGRARAVLRLVVTRLLWLVPLMLVVSMAIFGLAAASPFDPVAQYVGTASFTSPEVVEQIRANWGLDQPLWQQYLHWAGNLVQGELGPSRSQNRPVAEVITSRLGWSALLMTVAMVMVLVGSLVAGTLAAWFRDSWFDRALTSTSYALQAAPPFWLGLGAIVVFAVGLGWFPPGGVSSVSADGAGPAEVARHLVLPATVLAVWQSSWFTLFVRESVLTTLREDFVTGARARGLTERRVVFTHALRTSLLPYLTLIGTHLPMLIAGVILVETVFNWPGLGSVTVEAALGADFPLLAAITLLTTVVIVLGNLLADLLYTVADPRVGLDG